MATRRGTRLVLAAAGAAAVALVVLLAHRIPAASEAGSVVAAPRRAAVVFESPQPDADGLDRRPVRKASEVAATGARADTQDPPPPSVAGRATLLDGTPLGRRLVVATDTAAGPLSARSARTAEDGSFAIEVAEPGPHRLRLDEGAELPGGTREDVLAPARDVELRLDALLLRPAVDATGAASLGDESHLRISSFDADPPLPPSVSRWAHGSFTECLLPTGPGYLLEVERPRDRPLVAFLEPGLPSGVVDVLLQEGHPAIMTGALRAVPQGVAGRLSCGTLRGRKNWVFGSRRGGD